MSLGNEKKSIPRICAISVYHTCGAELQLDISHHVRGREKLGPTIIFEIPFCLESHGPLERCTLACKCVTFQKPIPSTSSSARQHNTWSRTWTPSVQAGKCLPVYFF